MAARDNDEAAAHRRHVAQGITSGSCHECAMAFEPECKQCAPFDCDDPDRHLGVDPKYTPLANRGCHCGADFDGRDCMCFEGEF